MKITNSLGVLVLALVVVGVSSSCQPQMTEPVPQVDLASIEAGLLAAWNDGDVDAYDAICTPEYAAHAMGVQRDMAGLPAVKDWIRSVRAAYPDIDYAIDDMFVSGDRVTLLWSWTGTNSGPLVPSPLYPDTPPTGKSVSLSGVAVLRLADGKVAESWSYYDMAGLLLQLGFTITPPAQATE
jgi:steroid delta-isomerase-like uncharacterized protein